VLTVAASAWLGLALLTGASASFDDPPEAPWGPLVRALPRWGEGSAGEVALTAAVAAAVVALIAREWLRSRRDAYGTGSTSVRRRGW
jgi:hypothetical protein